MSATPPAADGSIRPPAQRGRPEGKRRRPPSASHHRPRAGGRSHDAVREDRRFYADGTPVEEMTDGETTTTSKDLSLSVQQTHIGAGSAKRQKRENSSFFTLHKGMTDAESVAKFVREHIRDFSDLRGVNMFTQALSGRPEELFDAFFLRHKSEALFLLDRIYSFLSSGKATFTPAVHEYIIRCEQHGLRKAEWAEGVAPLEKQQPSLYSPREILKKLPAIDPNGRLTRLVEMSAAPSHLLRVTEKAAEFFTDGESTSVLSFKQQAQVLSKMVSKARRLSSSPKDSATGNTNSSAFHDTSDDNAPAAAAVVEKEEEKEEESESHIHETGTAAVSKTLPEEELQALRELIVLLFKTMTAVTRGRPSVETYPLFTKFLRFGEWARTAGLLGPAEEKFVSKLDELVQTALQAQQTQIEAVMKLKSAAQTPEELVALLDELWDEERGSLEPHSADVLSSLASTAATDAVDAALKERVVRCLLQTAKTCDLSLPRRAQRLVTDVMRAKKQQGPPAIATKGAVSKE